MESSDGGARGRPLRVNTVRGEPYYVGGRKLIPITRIVSFGKAKGTIGNNRVSGWGGGFVRITPLAVVEETAKGEHRIPITDATALALRGLFGAAVVITLFFAALRWLARRLRQAWSKS